MKAYPNCPKCHTDNGAKWLKEVTDKPYVVCMCIECNTIYNQLIEVQGKECLIIKPDHIKPVQILNEQGLFMEYTLPYNRELPVKTVKRTTSQARINSV